jgi:hypothetical protein
MAALAGAAKPGVTPKEELARALSVPFPGNDLPAVLNVPRRAVFPAEPSPFSLLLGARNASWRETGLFKGEKHAQVHSARPKRRLIARKDVVFWRFLLRNGLNRPQHRKVTPTLRSSQYHARVRSLWSDESQQSLALFGNAVGFLLVETPETFYL